jgi:hypothetical protein
VHADGAIEGLTPGAERLIWLLDLDGDDYRQWRVVWMRIIDLAAVEPFDDLLTPTQQKKKTLALRKAGGPRTPPRD